MLNITESNGSLGNLRTCAAFGSVAQSVTHKDKFVDSPVVTFRLRPPSDSVPSLGAVFLYLPSQQIRGRKSKLAIEVRYLYEARFLMVKINEVTLITTCWVDLDLLKALSSYVETHSFF